MEFFLNIILPLFLLLIGISGLYSGKIKISGGRFLSGMPVRILSLFYIVIAGAIFILPEDQFDAPTIGLLLVVTIVTILFGNTKAAPRYHRNN